MLQYILKPGKSSTSAFGWHHDSEWCQDELVTFHKYLSVGIYSLHSGIDISCNLLVINHYLGWVLQVWSPLQDVHSGGQMIVVLQRTQ